MAATKDESPTNAEREEVSQAIIRKYHTVPIGFYKLKDSVSRILANDNIIDAFLIPTAFVSLCLAFSFYPLLIAAVLAIVLFYVTLRHPLPGIMLFLVLVFLMLMYQAPAIAWVFMLIMTVTLVFGYMHYRSLTFMYLLVGLAFSPLGLLFEIPAFILSVLTLGYKRSIITLVAAVLIIVAFSSLFGFTNFGYILYNGVTAHKALGSPPILNYTTPASPGPSLQTFFSSGLNLAFSRFMNPIVTGGLGQTLALMVGSLSMQLFYLVELVVLLALVFVIDGAAFSSRSKYKGTKAAIFAIGYPIIYVVLAVLKRVVAANYFLLGVSYFLGLAFIYFLELYNVDIVKVIDVRKLDLRMKFGEAFEELAGGSSSETFDNIGNYEATKKELVEAILAPIEEKGISKAYNVKPARGILFFGPPGTGKTMIMRALANEIHGGFYYVKASNLISMYPGETEKRISEIFSIAKKNAPCVLFFDEIDFIAKSRESTTEDTTHRGALSQLLAEMDGFQKVKSVIVVGATNTPQVIDRAIMRPGRFDKVIYMPLPDYDGRKKIFKLYLAKLPVSKTLSYDKLANSTERYSGADIKTMVDTVAQRVAREAAAEHKILEITEADLLDIIKSTKPSTNLAQLDEYDTFKIEFERDLTSKERPVQRDASLALNRVVGMEDAKRALKDAIETPLLRPDLIKKYEIRSINGILLFGPPGNGKTMLMRAIANDLEGVTLFEINGSTLTTYGLDNAVTRIKEVFNSAKENTPSIIFIDEIDGLIPKREGASEAATRITVEMLGELDGIKKLSGVVVIAATNLPYLLDPAILRPGRFDKLIFVKPPGEQDRAAMFKQYLGSVPLEKDLDFKELGGETEGYTGADIANICREAKTRAMNKTLKSDREVPITLKDLEELVKAIKPSAPEKVLEQYDDFMEKYGQR